MLRFLPRKESHYSHKRKVVEDFFNYFSKNHTDSALHLLDDDLVWQCMGGEGSLPLCGVMKKEHIASHMNYIRTMLPQGLHLEPVGWTIQDERVAVEYVAQGQKANGLYYKNQYHFLMYVFDGKIVAVREYMDTLHRKRIFLDNLALS